MHPGFKILQTAQASAVLGVCSWELILGIRWAPYSKVNRSGVYSWKLLFPLGVELFLHIKASCYV